MSSTTSDLWVACVHTAVLTSLLVLGHSCQSPLCSPKQSLPTRIFQTGTHEKIKDNRMNSTLQSHNGQENTGLLPAPCLPSRELHAGLPGSPPKLHGRSLHISVPPRPRLGTAALKGQSRAPGKMPKGYVQPRGSLTSRGPTSNTFAFNMAAARPSPSNAAAAEAGRGDGRCAAIGCATVTWWNGCT